MESAAAVLIIVLSGVGNGGSYHLLRSKVIKFRKFSVNGSTEINRGKVTYKYNTCAVKYVLSNSRNRTGKPW